MAELVIDVGCVKLKMQILWVRVLFWSDNDVCRLEDGKIGLASPRVDF